jgi:hypothetical protein
MADMRSTFACSDALEITVREAGRGVVGAVGTS